MANIKSAKKRILVTEKKTARNKNFRTKMKTYLKKFSEAEEAGDLEKAEIAFDEAQKIVRKTASKGIIHKKNADRKVSRMKKRLSKMAH